jgi:predicted HTH transcriptional regulator
LGDTLQDNDQTSEKQAKNKRIRANTSEKKQIVIEYLAEKGQVTAGELATLFGLSDTRVRAILLEMVNDDSLEKVGKTKSTYYRLKRE